MILRIRSTKLGKIRFVGHRDLGRVWERALRRCDVAVAMTSGFTPRPRIAFGLALPMGAESLAEYVDVELANDATMDSAEQRRVADALDEVMPEGMNVVAVGIEPLSVGSLQESVVATGWELWGPDITADHVLDAVGLLERTELLVERERKGRTRTDDVRPAVEDLFPASDPSRLVARLSAVGRALRPAELAALAFAHVDPVDVRVLRTHQWIDHDGERREVLPLPTPVDAPPTRVGA